MIIKKEVNSLQILEIFDGFGGVFLGALSLFLKQQWDISLCIERADSLAEGLHEEIDGFETVNLNYSWESQGDDELVIHYFSRSGNEYKFILNKGFALWDRKKSHRVEFFNGTSLESFIEKVCASEGTHPNPLFRRNTTTTDTEI